MRGGVVRALYPGQRPTRNYLRNLLFHDPKGERHPGCSLMTADLDMVHCDLELGDTLVSIVYYRR